MDSTSETASTRSAEMTEILIHKYNRQGQVAQLPATEQDNYRPMVNGESIWFCRIFGSYATPIDAVDNIIVPNYIAQESEAGDDGKLTSLIKRIPDLGRTLWRNDLVLMRKRMDSILKNVTTLILEAMFNECED